MSGKNMCRSDVPCVDQDTTRTASQEEISEIQKEWLDRARRTVFVALRTRFGISREQATDALDEAVRRVSELLKHGAGFPYSTSVLMYVSRFAHAWLNQ